MHHNPFGSVKGDTLCPLGFHPQVRWPTRCKRCYRDYKDHLGKRSAGLKAEITSSSPTLSKWESSPSGFSEDLQGKRVWSSTSNLTKDGSNNRTRKNEMPTEVWSNSAADLSDKKSSASTPDRPKSYVGPQTESYTFRRHSVDEMALRNNEVSSNSFDKPPKLQIRQVIENSSSSNDNNVEFIVQVRKSNDKKEETGSKNEIERLKEQLGEMKVKCERVEREKSEILLRRLATMDSVSSKTAKSTEMSRLQKSLKELQLKNEALSEEKTALLGRIKSLERESGSRNSSSKAEREKTTNEDLKSKLRAAETLCESLMDENEDMKKEIRELEEEMYEMQDNFREEQADEYTNLRKNLEQSNKNCRILSFKLRKVERKSEQLENDKAELETKYDEVKRVEDVLRKLTTDLKSRGLTKTSEYSTKLQLRKMLEEVEKELGDAFSGFANVMNAGLEMPGLKGQDAASAKYEKLCKEHELLQHKLDNAMKELNDKGATKPADSTKNEFLLKKKLNEAMTARDSERKSWEGEKRKLEEEKENLKSKLLSLSAEKMKVYNEVLEMKKDLEVAKSTEKNNVKMETSLNDLKRELHSEREKCKKLQEDLSITIERECRISKTLSSLEQTKSSLESELKRSKADLESTKSSMSVKLEKLTAELVEATKEGEKWKTRVDEEKMRTENEVASLKAKLTSLEKFEVNSKEISEMKENFIAKISILEEELMKGQDLYDQLHNKHASLQDIKRRVENDNHALKTKLKEFEKQSEVLSERMGMLESLQKSKEDIWLKEKNHLQELVKEKDRLKSNIQLEDSRDEVSRLTKEIESLKIQLDDVKKINDDLASKLNDYNAVTKIQRNLSADTSALDQELRKSQAMLADAEKARKTDVAECKMRYENRIKAINDEIQSIQNQLSRYKRERDTYKHMLEGAQKTIADLKVARQRRQSSTSTGKSDEDDHESTATNVFTLERQINLIEDELSESKLEVSKLKTELVSEKSRWQIKTSEMQSRINELEEERILASGRTKIPGLKARIELAWQKEREEQQRLLQETATLARDLRQTLYEVERERDKERLENNRRQEQSRKIYEEEKEENRKKLIELQCDLLELRDAHAKLRTSNEKLRREKERHEREREDLKDIIASKRRHEQNEAKNINTLLRQVDDLTKLFPALDGRTENNSNNKVPDSYTPTPPRRLKGPKSRESSPMHDTKDDSIRGSLNNVSGRTEKLEYTIGKLMEVAKELRDSKKISGITDSASKKKYGIRSSSIENDSGRGSSSSSSNRSKATLKRKSLSLEQTAGKNDQLIWGTDSNVSSIQSLDSEIDPRYFSMGRDSSVDSRLSGGSTKSEMIQRDKKHNKNLIRKIATRLTKSVSVDDPNSSYDYSLQTSGSETSIADDIRTEKKNLKKKLSDMFKRGSKSNGLDKKTLESSRPPSRSSNISRISKS